MPTFTPIQFDPKVISLSVERDAVRSPGIHLSSILKDRLITAGIERKTKGSSFTPEEQHLLYERGFLWERMVKEYCELEEWRKREIEFSANKHLAAGILETAGNALTRPGECFLDGVYMTPDAIDLKNYWVEEWKATALRQKNFFIEDRRPEWLWQGASYCNIFGMNKAVFRIWHVSDNVINSILVEWTPEEIKENWRRILEHWEHMRERK